MANYFKFFEIEESFNLDLDTLRTVFISNSKKYHPDFHTLSDTQNQDQVLELSTINNDAWKTLSDPQRRIQHLLSIYNVMPEEGKASVPQDFLLEMMDINEALMELEFDEQPSKKEEVVESLNSIESSLNDEGQAAMDAWDEDKEPGFLEIVRDYYLKMKYIKRVKERLD